MVGVHVCMSARESITAILCRSAMVFLIYSFMVEGFFQQWTVDMYVKLESMRLDWYSNPEHQKIIRADLYQVHLNILASFNTFFVYVLLDLSGFCFH